MRTSAKVPLDFLIFTINRQFRCSRTRKPPGMKFGEVLSCSLVEIRCDKIYYFFGGCRFLPRLHFNITEVGNFWFPNFEDLPLSPRLTFGVGIRLP